MMTGCARLVGFVSDKTLEKLRMLYIVLMDKQKTASAKTAKRIGANTPLPVDQDYLCCMLNSIACKWDIKKWCSLRMLNQKQ